jgi:tRNA dimethylallyltransferase
MTRLPPAIFLLGPTASGKTGLALELVRRLPCEIISVDSALVYRHMDIGTAKPDAATLAQAPHRLVDIREPNESYSAAQFSVDALAAMKEICAAGRIPLLVGGTLLYVKALREGLNDLPQADAAVRATIDAMAKMAGWPALHQELLRVDPETAARLAPHDAQRIQRALEVHYLTGRPMSELLREQRAGEFPYQAILLALIPEERARLHADIARRFQGMLEAGFLDEVQWLRENYALDPAMPSMRCVGYRQAWQYLDGELDMAGLVDKGVAATRQLAKRQLTWLRAMAGVTRFDCHDERVRDKVVECLQRELQGLV